MSARRHFLRVTAKFDKDTRAKKLLIPIDQISYVSEDLSPAGGCELHWTDRSGDRAIPTATHLQEDTTTVHHLLIAAGSAI